MVRGGGGGGGAALWAADPGQQVDLLGIICTGRYNTGWCYVFGVDVYYELVLE